MSKGPFKLRSGNSPLFKQMGASPTKDMKTGSYSHKFEDNHVETPAYLNEFGIGKGASPVDYTIQKGDTLSKIAADNNMTVEDLLASNPDIKDPNKINAGANLNLKTKEDKETDTGGPDKGIAEGIEKGTVSTEDRKPIEGKGKNVWGKIAKGLKTGAGVAFAGLTSGLDAVYGTGKVLPDASGKVSFYDKTKKENKDNETGEEKVDKLIA